MQNKYTNALKKEKTTTGKNVTKTELIATAILTLVFSALLFILLPPIGNMEQPKKLSCSSYIDTRCEGYVVPMCVRE
ncbi:MAG: hypothetical protein RL642_294 [Bacteroidota bacterium]|jgi:uncharacterized protein YqhQ